MSDRNPPKERLCHRASFEKSCRELVINDQCCMWKEIRGHHPQDENQVISSWGCIDEHMFMLALQNGLQQDRVIASTDKVANEVKKGRDENVAAGAMLIQRAQSVVREAVSGVLAAHDKQLALTAD